MWMEVIEMAYKISLKPKQRSDAYYVEGMYKRNPFVSQELYNFCKKYFDNNYRGVFFAKDESKMEIFQNAFIKLWENIEHLRIYVEDGVLKGKDGQPFTSSLTTYFMSIARNMHREWVRDHPVINKNVEEENVKVIRKDGYDENWLIDVLYGDDAKDIQLDIIADVIAHMPTRCSEILTKFYYEEKCLDEILLELPSIGTKDALKTRKYKCMEELKKTATSIYQQYVNN